jgi:hypothetical protein
MIFRKSSQYFFASGDCRKYRVFFVLKLFCEVDYIDNFLRNQLRHRKNAFTLQRSIFFHDAHPRATREI